MVAGAAGVFTEVLVLETVSMSNVAEWCEGEYELVVMNEGAVAG
jgi:hypothetical protein